MDCVLVRLALIASANLERWIGDKKPMTKEKSLRIEAGCRKCKGDLSCRGGFIVLPDQENPLHEEMRNKWHRKNGERVVAYQCTNCGKMYVEDELGVKA